MNKKGGGIYAGLTIGAAFAALFVLASRARAEAIQSDNFDLPLIDYTDPPDVPLFPTPSQNLAAFLFMIRSAENRQVNDFERYNRFYSNLRFNNLSDHPVNTGEMRGVPLSDAMCRAAGFRSGCVSTAAGAYQIIKPTWDRVRRAGSWGGRLPDFSPQSQDEAGRRLLVECGALPLIERGDIAGAVARCARTWASLPGSTAGQGGVSMDEALAFFDEGLNYA